MQDHLLKVFENLSDHFGILGIKELSIFIKNFIGICYFLLLHPLSLRQLAYIYIYICAAIF